MHFDGVVASIQFLCFETLISTLLIYIKYFVTVSKYWLILCEQIHLSCILMPVNEEQARAFES